MFALFLMKEEKGTCIVDRGRGRGHGPRNRACGEPTSTGRRPGETTTTTTAAAPTGMHGRLCPPFDRPVNSAKLTVQMRLYTASDAYAYVNVASIAE
jgi:hypothetical protein